MGFDDRVFRQRLSRKFRLIDDGERVGSMVTGADDDVAELCFVNGAARHLYGEVHKAGTVLEGLLVYPGEHHTVLPCAAPTGAAFIPGRGWWSNDPALAWTLQSTEATLGLERQDWKWFLKGRNVGSYVRAEWVVQVAPLDGRTHLVVRGLQPQGFADVDAIGLSFFLRVAWTLQSALANAPAGPTVEHPYPSVFGARAREAFADEAAWSAPPSPRDVAAEIARLLAPLADEQITLAPLDPKREKAARAAMPPSWAGVPIVALLGTVGGVLDPPKLAVVTPTHLAVSYERTGDRVRTTMPWSELLDARPEGDDVYDVFFRSSRFGWVLVPGCKKASRVADAFATLARGMRG